jgi:hypothetical protein
VRKQTINLSTQVFDVKNIEIEDITQR